MGWESLSTAVSHICIPGRRSDAFEIEREEALEDLGVGEVGRPAVGGEDGGVEGGVGVVR